MAIKLIRSPRYPIIGLREAIERVAAVYREDNRNKIPKELVAEHMGYQGLNGKSLGIISAVSKYGLLEGGIEAMWVTPLAIDILERDVDDPERVAAIRAAAKKVDLYNDIDAQFPDKVSDSAIRSFLITKRGFLPESAERLIRSYRETKDLVATTATDYESELGEAETEPMQTQPFTSASAPYVAASAAAATAGQRRTVFDLSEGEVVITFPDELSPESVNDLQDYLNVFMKKAKREAGVQ